MSSISYREYKEITKGFKSRHRKKSNKNLKVGCYYYIDDVPQRTRKRETNYRTVMYGKYTEEFKQKLSEDRKGKCTRKERQLSEKTKEKLSKALTGREATWNKPVLQFDKQGNFIKEYPSAKIAKKETGAKNIFEVASGYKNQLYKSSGGFIWKYKE